MKKSIFRKSRQVTVSRRQQRVAGSQGRSKACSILVMGVIVTLLATSGDLDAMDKPTAIPALTPQSTGRQFVLIGDPHAVTEDSQFQAINTVINRLQPAPEFVCLAGDHIWGWTEDESKLNKQWLQWFSQNTSLLRHTIYHCTANHPVVGPKSAALYAKLFADIPDNGPEDGKQLNYYIRNKDFLLVVVNTAWNLSSETTGRMGGQGVDTAWLDQVLTDNQDATYKFVMGHHPVFPVDGFSGSMLVEARSGKKMWNLLVRHGVHAYLCAHVIAFDAQVHEGVLQIASGGAGFPFFFGKSETEYNHCVQIAVDSTNLRYQTLDTEGILREWLSWPLQSPAIDSWPRIDTNKEMPSSSQVTFSEPRKTSVVFMRLQGTANNDASQTILSSDDKSWWIGLEHNQLRIRLQPIPPRDNEPETGAFPGPDQIVKSISFKKEIDPMVWTGPALSEGEFDLQIAIHMGMGPGGFLYRTSEHQLWSSMDTSSWHGPNDAGWPKAWSIEKNIQVSCLLDVQIYQ